VLASRTTLRLLLYAALTFSAAVLAGESLAQDNARPMPIVQLITVHGQFLHWRNARSLVVSSGPGQFSLLDLDSRSSSPLENEQPDPNDVRITARDVNRAPQYTFVESINLIHAISQYKTKWFRYLSADNPYIMLRQDLIDANDGAIELYVADPRDYPIGERVTMIKPSMTSRYALFVGGDSTYKALPLELTPTTLPQPANLMYRWNTVASRKDATDGRYFLFFSNERFRANPSGVQGWTPFNTWWIDVKQKTIEHVLLPAGPWVADAKTDGPLRKFICHPSDCDTFRHYDFKVAGHKIFVRITAERAVLNGSTLGIYEFDSSANAWLRVADNDATFEQLSPDGCAVAINKGRDVSILSICLPPT
jgi:hypothetical protein